MCTSSKSKLPGTIVLALGIEAVLFPVAVRSAAAKPPAKVVKPNETKGQTQTAGANGQFGTIYTLKNGFNFEILSAHYSLGPFLAYEILAPHTEEKLVVCDIAIKNSRDGDNFFNSEGMFTFVDSTGQLTNSGNVSLESSGEKAYPSTLKSGQGIGQPGLKNPFRVAARLPAKARIVKIIVNVGRAGTKEDVLRYYVAGATKEEAGEAGNPKNIISPLSEDVRDPADASGSTALDEGKGIIGTYYPSGFFNMKLDSFAYSTDPLQGEAPGEGKRYAVATVTVQHLTETAHSMFDVEGGDFPVHQLIDSDGEKYKPDSYLKAKRDENAQNTFAKGDEYTFRIVFKIPKDAAAKKLTLGTGQSRKWAYDVSAIKSAP